MNRYIISKLKTAENDQFYLWANALNNAKWTSKNLENNSYEQNVEDKDVMRQMFEYINSLLLKQDFTHG